MNKENNTIEIMKKRISVRTYDGQPLEEKVRRSLEAFLADVPNPFGVQTRFALLSVDGAERIGTYGFISGVKQYVAGCVKQGGMDLEGYGYAMERIVLQATEMGLGTCWLGIFKRGAFGDAMKPDGELMPAVAAIGVAAGKRSLMDRAVAAGAGARKRKPLETLFFEEDFNTPINASGPLKECLEMVRIGPSASNKQPWRAARQGEAVHFYLAETPGYAGNKLPAGTIQRVDMGIAACQMEMAAEALGLPGGFVVSDPKLNAPEGWSYSYSWR